jgi:uncharacterized protein
MDNLKMKLVEALLRVLPDCQAIYRFGSWGTTAERPGSDIDLAVLPVNPLDPAWRWELAQSLASLAKQDVDLVDLTQASTVLRMQVVAHGERIYCSDEAEAEMFEDRVFSSYARLNEERREILSDVRRRGSIYGK